MNIALIGYGKMGKAIKEIAEEKGHHVSLIIDKKNSDQMNAEHFKDIDVAIEFSTPEAAVHNFKKCFEMNIPVVTGTTGWYDEMEEIKDICLQEEKSMIWGSNFSVGVNIFFKINTYLARIAAKHKEYQPFLSETHHTAKLDKPSGTAISLANQILEEYKNLDGWSLEQEKDKLPVEAKREEGIFGIHEISYQSEIDDIQIKHTAKSRKGFALGAVLAAEWLHNKKGFYSFYEIFDNII